MSRKPLLAMMAIVVLATVPSFLLADSISPTSFSATLTPGESVTITKTVTVSDAPAMTAPIDIFFLTDATGSMGSAINNVKNAAASILSQAASLPGDVAFGVGEYKDFGDSYGAYRLNTDITTSQAAAQTGINMWGASGGGDYEEANLFALNEVATNTSWRAGSTRILVWFGDAPGHDPSGGVTEASATAALVSNNIEVQAISVLNRDFVAPFGGTATGLNDSGQAERIANATGGTFYNNISTANIVATINAAITDAFSSYSSVALSPDGASPVGVSINPGAYFGSFDRSTEETFTFDVTFTAPTTPGVYDFSIDALVDGGVVATETDHIVVGTTPVPEPSTLILLGTGVLGLLGCGRRRRNNK